MTRVSTILGASLAVGGLLTGGVPLQAQEAEGIIRISDRMVQPISGAVAGNCPQAATAGPVAYSDCPSYGYEQCGTCGQCWGRCHCHHRLKNAVCHILQPHGGCTVSPDHGWAPPGKLALWRRPVAYNKYFPNHWMGYPAGPPVAPLRQVYMPTDTTQLGYYYQHVPMWVPNPQMIPPAPNPNDWHQPLMGGPAGAIVGTGYVIESAPTEVEADSETPAAPTPPAPEELAEPMPEADDVVPPPPVDAAARDLQRPADEPALQPTPGQSAG
jgi:hypothetical protein